MPDARLNPVFAHNPLVSSGAVRGYLGVPLQTVEGTVLGSLCLLDSKPLMLGVEAVESLRLLARRVAGELELQLLRKAQPRKVAAPKAKASAHLEAVLGAIEMGVLLMVGPERRILYANRALSRLVGMPEQQLLQLTREQWVEQVCSLFDDPSDFLHKMKVLPNGPFAAREEFEVQRPLPRVLRWTSKPVDLGGEQGQLALYEDITAQRALERAQEQLAVTDELPLMEEDLPSVAPGASVTVTDEEGREQVFTLDPVGLPELPSTSEFLRAGGKEASVIA